MRRRGKFKPDRPISKWQKVIVVILTFALLFAMAGTALLRNSFTVSAETTTPAASTAASPAASTTASTTDTSEEGKGAFEEKVNFSSTIDCNQAQAVLTEGGNYSYTVPINIHASGAEGALGFRDYFGGDVAIRNIRVILYDKSGKQVATKAINASDLQQLETAPSIRDTATTGRTETKTGGTSETTAQFKVTFDGLKAGEQYKVVPEFDVVKKYIFGHERVVKTSKGQIQGHTFTIDPKEKNNIKTIECSWVTEVAEKLADSDCEKLFPSDYSKSAWSGGQVWNSIKLGLCSVIFGVVGGALGSLSEWATKFFADWSFGSIEQLKKGELAGGAVTTDKAGNTVQPWDYQIWQVARSVVDIILVIALIIIAFANILHIQLDTYAVKKILGPLIGAAIAANLSWWLLRVIVAFAANLPYGMIGIATAGLEKFANANGHMVMIGALIGMFAGGPWVGVLVGGIFVLAGVLISVFLAFMLFIQPFILSILVAVAPVAIMGYALPPLRGFFDKWVKMFFNWAFMSTVLILIFSLMKYLPAIDPGSATGAKGMMTMFMIYILYVGLAVLAVRVPFTMGGDISNAWFKAGKWLGGRASNRFLYGAFGAQVSHGEAKKRYDAAGARIKELNARGGLSDEERKELISLQKERRRLARNPTNIYGRTLARGVSAAHPRAIIEGMKAREAGQEEAIMGLLPTYSASYARTAGKATVYKNVISGEMYKARNAPPQKVIQKVTKLLEENGLTDQEIAYFFSESEGGFPGKLALGAILKRVSGSDAAELRAWLMQLAQNARMESGGRMQFPDAARFAAQHRMLNYFGMRDLALANMTEDDKGKIITDRQVEEELARRYGADQVGRYMADIKDIQNERSGQRKLYQNVLEQAGGAGQPSGAEAGPAPTYEDPAARFAAIAEEESKGDNPSGEITQGARAEVENVPPAGSPVQQVEVVNPVTIGAASAIPVADEGARSVAREGAVAVKQNMRLEAASVEAQKGVAEVLQNSPLTPDAIGISMEEALRSVPRIGDTRLSPKSEALLQKYLISSVRGDRLVTSTSRAFARENLRSLQDYTGPVSEQIRSGKLSSADATRLVGDISQRTKTLREAGESAAPEVSAGLRQDLSRAGVNIAGAASTEQLTRHGENASVILGQVTRPEVKGALQAPDYTPAKMHEAIVQQTARDLVRSTALQQISNAIRTNVVAGVPVSPEEKTSRVEVQIGSFIRNSPYAPEVGKLPQPRQVELIRNVSRLLIGQNIEINDTSIDNATRNALKSIATSTPGGPQQPPPGPEGAGGATMQPKKPPQPPPRRSQPPQTPPATPEAPPPNQPPASTR